MKRKIKYIPGNRFEEPRLKLWEGLCIAIRDFSRATRDPNVEIDMGGWFSARAADKTIDCTVCFAGAVMAYSIGSIKAAEAAINPFGKRTEKLVNKIFITDDVEYAAMDFNNMLSQRFYALDRIRRGDVTSAIGKWYGSDAHPYSLPPAKQVKLDRALKRAFSEPRALHDEYHEICIHDAEDHSEVQDFIKDMRKLVVILSILGI